MGQLTLTINLDEKVYRALEQRAASRQSAVHKLAAEALAEWLDLIPDDGQSQAWYWTERWQAGAQTAEADGRAGRYKDFATMDEFINALDEPLDEETEAREFEHRHTLP